MEHLKGVFRSPLVNVTVGRRDDSASLGWSPVTTLFPPQPRSAERATAKTWYQQRDLGVVPELQELLRGAGQVRAMRQGGRHHRPSSLVAANLAALGGRDRLTGALPVSDASEVYFVLTRQQSESDFEEADERALCREMGFFEREARWLVLSTGVLFGARPFSQREREVSSSLVAGQSEKEIANQLDITPGYAHQLVVRVYRKLGVQCRAQFMALWLHGPDDTPPSSGLTRVP